MRNNNRTKETQRRAPAHFETEQTIRKKVLAEEWEKFTLSNALDNLYCSDEEVNSEKAIRVVAFLLRYLHDNGDVDASVAFGLGSVLYTVADNEKRLRIRRKIDEQLGQERSRVS